MQTLGLSSESKRSDGWLKSLLWPTVENAWDVNYLGQQGFWICLLVAAYVLGTSVLSGQIVIALIGVLTAIFYFLGGIGVREASWPAAAMVFSVYILGLLGNIAGRQVPGVISLLFAAILLSNLRATFLASEWVPAAEGEDRPTRFAETLADKLVDRMPAKVWPAMQIAFYVLGVIVLLLTVVGLAFLLALRFGLLGLPHVPAATH